MIGGDKLESDAKFLKQTRFTSLDHEIMKKNPSAENGMELVR